MDAQRPLPHRRQRAAHRHRAPAQPLRHRPLFRELRATRWREEPMMAAITDILRDMEYGPSPESDEHVRAWLAAHRGGFGHFIAGRVLAPGALFDVNNPATGERIAARHARERRPTSTPRSPPRAQALPKWSALQRRSARAPSLRAGAPRAEARALSRRAGERRQRQADPRNARHRHSAGRAPFLSSRRLGLADRRANSRPRARSASAARSFPGISRC